ncbi:GNAT family N-acetyltransferase [Bermanella marisrubri]|nr:GNAT family N-acetyltransferase [Bermanella marisrubri]
MTIREADTKDFEQIWPFFHVIVAAGTTYAYPTEMTKQEAINTWMVLPEKTYVAEHEGEILGSYYLKTNMSGPGSHVCNCGYMVSDSARGKGVATAMCEHSQEQARQLGYRAMQFNFVASTNTGAIRLWEKLGFEKVGRLPGAFKHPQEGYVDAFVMFKDLMG